MTNEKPELTEDQLDNVTGGPSDYLLEIDGIAGESTKRRRLADDVVVDGNIVTAD